MSAADEPVSHFPADFQAAVTAQLRADGYTIVGWEQNGVNVRPPDGGDEQYIGLENLHRRVRAAAPAEWPEMIHSFLERLARAATAPDIPHDLTTITDRLRPRLGRPFDRSAAHPWGIPLPGTGLEITLVVDFPHTMAFVTDEMLKRSRTRGEDLLDVALENLRTATPAEFFERASPEHDIYIGHTGDSYDATRALLLEELMPDSPAGFWVAIPSREELAVWPVSFPAIKNVHGLHLFATENFREHAYPITDDVFWVWQGMWHPFITLRNGDSVIDPPDLFIEALQELEGPRQ
ncbi:hypothetical protein J8F10_27465 [Gemmata sp. G18]|uniref:Uncharacterized protein n=1 Tax=Gemmata palustris TaxID=2822762 RepID=A0ABS5BZ77_9BACT|nr:hypothetical protein [Gemmata palustris]MBP3958999.1 hypothetical protein [Gemmata palustris]